MFLTFYIYNLSYNNSMKKCFDIQLDNSKISYRTTDSTGKLISLLICLFKKTLKKMFTLA